MVSSKKNTAHWGIDFGTTNTAVCRLTENNEPEVFKLGAAQQNPYMPSVVAVRSGQWAGTFFGSAAKQLIGRDNVVSYHNFKMLLAEPDDKIQKIWGAGRAKPEDITNQFIEHLMNNISLNNGGLPDSVLVTIPEIWQRQSLLAKRELLLKAFKNCGVKVRSASEPVAAVTYYLHCFKKKYDKDFSGHLLVCDCGGGTMDFCLVRASVGEAGHMPIIRVLERTGNGMVEDSLGSAGVAFDHRVIASLFPLVSGEKFYANVRDFESCKIEMGEIIRTVLKAYLVNPGTMEGEAIFDIDQGKVTPELLVSVFDECIRAGIEEALNELKGKLGGHDILEQDEEQFRVLMVGGFSSFYLVQETIKAALGNVGMVDARFEDIFGLDDRALAIAKGAALIANNQAQIIETCPADVGLYCTDTYGQQQQQVLLKEGTNASVYYEPVWWKDHPVRVMSLNQEMPFFFAPSGRSAATLSSGPLSSILPPGIKVEGKIEVGFSLGEDDMTVYVHLRDAANYDLVRKTSLGDLQEKMQQGSHNEH